MNNKRDNKKNIKSAAPGPASGDASAVAPKVEGAPLFDPDIFSSDMDYYIQEYCSINNIEDLKKDNNNTFCGVLLYLNRKCIKDRINLKETKLINNSHINTTFNRYNYDLVNKILNIYIDICYRYNKDISIYAFSYLVGIPIDTISNWMHNEATSASFQIWQKLHEGRELCLANKLSDGNKNPVGIIAILNHSYNWATTAAAQGSKQSALDTQQLPTLGNASGLQALPDHTD